MPPGSKPGERRMQMPRRPPDRKGYLGKYVAKVAGVSPSRISNLVKKGDLETHDDGSIKKESAHIYYKDEFTFAGVLTQTLEPAGYYREAESGLKSVGGNEWTAGSTNEEVKYHFGAARAKQAHMQARKIELEVEQLEGNLVLWSEIEYSIAAIYSEVVQSVLALPDQLTPLVVGNEDEPEVHDIIGTKAESIIAALRNNINALLEQHYAEHVGTHNGVHQPPQLPISKDSSTSRQAT